MAKPLCPFCYTKISLGTSKYWYRDAWICANNHEFWAAFFYAPDMDPDDLKYLVEKSLARLMKGKWTDDA
jgi:hypothetical protein